MAKYSTGGGAGGGGGRTCELCGTAADGLRPATVAGAEIEVCPECAPHDERSGPGGEQGVSSGGDEGGRDEQERRRRAARNTARASDAVTRSSDRWEQEGANYDDDQLPYLVPDYGDRVEAARQNSGYQRDELAAELDVAENELLAIEQGRANQAGVGGSVIRSIEEHLDLRLVEE